MSIKRMKSCKCNDMRCDFKYDISHLSGGKSGVIWVTIQDTRGLLCSAAIPIAEIIEVLHKAGKKFYASSCPDKEKNS